MPAGRLSTGEATLVVARRESVSLWRGGRGMKLLFLYSLFLSVMAFLAATDSQLSLLSQRDTTILGGEISAAIGGLLTLIVAADAFSGEKERATLEAVLATPVPRQSLAMGKVAAALSMWAATYVVTLPYLWMLGASSGVFLDAALLDLVAGVALAAGLAGVGVTISSVARTNRTSLSLNLLAFLAFAAPALMPVTTLRGWFGQALNHLNPLLAMLQLETGILTKNEPWGDVAVYFVPLVAVAILGLALARFAVPRRTRFFGGGFA
ncbi:MAG: ABC transporter permease subunit [Thermoplasmatota archaeon]